MKQLLCALLLGLVAILWACGPDKPVQHPVMKMAPFDLDCRDVHYTVFDENNVGATGCGRRVRYVRMCTSVPDAPALISPNSVESCRWVKN